MRIALTQGYRVRAVVRKQEQIESLSSHPQIVALVDNAEFVVVPDMAQMGAFDSVMEGVSVVLHLASPLAKEVYPTMLCLVSGATDSYRLTTTSETSSAQPLTSNHLSSPRPS